MEFRGWEHLYWLDRNAARCRYNLGYSQVADYPYQRRFLLTPRNGTNPAPPFGRVLADFLDVPRANVLPTNGASEANFLVFAALLKPGDEVVAERPGYFPMSETPRGLGLRVKRFTRRDDFSIDLSQVEQALTRRTKMVVVTNPHNPSGVAAGKPLEELADLCARRRIILLCDEVYRRIDPRTPTLAGRPWTVVNDSLTKSWGLGALHCGWMVAQPRWIARARRVQEFVVAGVPPVSVHLGSQAIAMADEILGRGRSIVRRNREILESWSKRSGILVSSSRAAVAAVRTGGDSLKVAKRARDRGVLVVPGEVFDGRRFVRVSIGAATGVREGLELLTTVVR